MFEKRQQGIPDLQFVKSSPYGRRRKSSPWTAMISADAFVGGKARQHDFRTGLPAELSAERIADSIMMMFGGSFVGLSRLCHRGFLPLLSAMLF